LRFSAAQKHHNFLGKRRQFRKREISRQVTKA
jgi:hypothetical protein